MSTLVKIDHIEIRWQYSDGISMTDEAYGDCVMVTTPCSYNAEMRHQVEIEGTLKEHIRHGRPPEEASRLVHEEILRFQAWQQGRIRFLDCVVTAWGRGEDEASVAVATSRIRGVESDCGGEYKADVEASEIDELRGKLPEPPPADDEWDAIPRQEHKDSLPVSEPLIAGVGPLPVRPEPAGRMRYVYGYDRVGRVVVKAQCVDCEGVYPLEEVADPAMCPNRHCSEAENWLFSPLPVEDSRDDDPHISSHFPDRDAYEN